MDVAFDLGRPVPFEVRHRFELSEGGETQPPFQATAGTLLGFGSIEFFQKHI